LRRKGKNITATFLRRKEADEWALATERKIDRGVMTLPNFGNVHLEAVKPFSGDGLLDIDIPNELRVNLVFFALDAPFQSKCTIDLLCKFEGYSNCCNFENFNRSPA
jgi:hypothetical protein